VILFLAGVAVLFAVAVAVAAIADVLEHARECDREAERLRHPSDPGWHHVRIVRRPYDWEQDQ
jgi:hypothetical protein